MKNLSVSVTATIVGIIDVEVPDYMNFDETLEMVRHNKGNLEIPAKANIQNKFVTICGDIADRAVLFDVTYNML